MLFGTNGVLFGRSKTGKFTVAFQYGLTSMRQQVTYGGNFGSDQEGQFTKFYSEDGSFEVVKNNATGQEKHILYIGGTPYESNIVYLKDFTQSSGSYTFLHKDYIGSILAISDEAGNKLEQRHFDAWGNFTHLQIGNGAIMTDHDAILSAAKNLIIDRGYTSHEHFMEVGIIHMNGRLYDPLLRRFLNADDNIQDPTNTQNYNKYGYVMNNPLMFNDPSGEFWEAGLFLTILAYAIPAAAIGAAIGAAIYITFATINNNFSLGGFARSILVGAATGAISTGIGQVFIAASGFWGGVGVGALTGAGTGGVTALITGQNFLEGVLKGAVIGGAVAGVSWVINELTNNYEYQVNEMPANNNNTLQSGTKADFSYDTVKKIDQTRYKGQLIRGSYKIVDETSDLSPKLVSEGYTFDKTSGLLDGPRGKAYGLTESLTNKGKLVWQRIYLPKGTFVSLEQLDLTMGHEIFHSILNNARLFETYTLGATNAKHYVHEHFTAKWENAYVKFRNWKTLNLNVMNLDDTVLSDIGLKGLINKITPIFNNYLKSTLK